MALSLAVLYKASGNNVQQLGRADTQLRAAALAESLMAWRDGVPATGWTDAGTTAGFDWTITSAPVLYESSGGSPGAASAEGANAGTSVARNATGVPSAGQPPRLHDVNFSIFWRDNGTPRSLQWKTTLPELAQSAVDEKK